jgi:heterodisulfide reductase subunit A-like polyferredoxin
MCLECLVGVDSQSAPDCLVRVDSHSDESQGRVLSAITKDEAMEFAPVGKYPSTGINVLIVGTGFGGLTAALEFTRKGHNVRVLERNNEPDVSGKSDGRSCCPSEAILPLLSAID